MDRRNQVVLAGLGLLVLAGGVLALLAGAGVFGAGRRDEPVLGPDVRAFAASHSWFWPAVGVAAALVTVLAIGWLVAQRGTGRVRGLAVAGEPSGGVRLSAAALTDAVEADVRRIDDVERAHATLRGRRRAPFLEIVVAVGYAAAMAEIRGQVEGPVLRRARAATGRPNLLAQVDLIPGGDSARRVR